MLSRVVSDATVALSGFAVRVTGSPLPAPDQPLTEEVDADLVTPGLWGFATLFLSAVAVYFLSRSMARRVQRVNHRARLQAGREAEPAPAEREPKDHEPEEHEPEEHEPREPGHEEPDDERGQRGEPS